MFKKIFKSISIFILFFTYSCQSPSTIAFDEGLIRKGMDRKEMSKVFKYKVLAAHNPFKGECYHEYYPLKKMEIISGNAHILIEIQSTIEPVFYILKNVSIESHSTRFGNNECLHGNGTLDAWVKGHYEALDYISKN